MHELLIYIHTHTHTYIYIYIYIYICRDTIFNDTWMTLGSYVKGPNNMICKEWVWKGLLLGAGYQSGPGRMRAHTEIGLDCIAEPCTDVV